MYCLLSIIIVKGADNSSIITFLMNMNLLQESFHPVKITEGLWIVPEWRTPPV